MTLKSFQTLYIESIRSFLTSAKKRFDSQPPVKLVKQRYSILAFGSSSFCRFTQLGSREAHRVFRFAFRIEVNKEYNDFAVSC